MEESLYPNCHDTERIAHYLDLQFKRDMIDRGFAPDEIERLVRAGGESASDCAAECDPAARRSRHAG